MTPASVDAGAALAAAGAVGPYFETSAWAPDAGWRPLTELTHDDEAMRERVASATAVLAGMSGSSPDVLAPRVVASTVFLGLAARLVAAPLATAVVQRVLPRMSDEALWWQPTSGGPWPLAVREPVGWPVGDLSDAVGLFAEDLRSGPVALLVERVQADFALSTQVLWGNVASALVGAMKMLSAARPDRSAAAHDLVAAVLRAAPLAGTGTLDPGATRVFVRRSCCLFYRVPGGGLCADCVLVDRSGSAGPE